VESPRYQDEIRTIFMLPHRVSGQGFPENANIQAIFDCYADKEDCEEMTALIEPDQENILTVLWRGLR
jgi:hypothetical protein